MGMVNGRANHMVNGASNMTTKNRKSKQAPPSRLRYESNNPTVSARVSQEIKEELDELRLMSGLSMADILKAGLDRLKPDTEASYERGLKDGYQIAKEEFEVMAQCFGCGEAHLSIVGETMKAVAAQKVTGWTGRGCQ